MKAAKTLRFIPTAAAPKLITVCLWQPNQRQDGWGWGGGVVLVVVSGGLFLLDVFQQPTETAQYSESEFHVAEK